MGELQVMESGGTAMVSVFDRMPDPLVAAEKIGDWFVKSKMFGVTTPEQGRVLALTCIMEKKNPIEFMRTYHPLTDGKLLMRADAMLAEFNKRGGEHEWLETGESGTATVRLSKNGKSIDSSYSMKDAEKAKIIKSGGGWEKNPANMLRARCVSNGIRMIDPQVCAGAYTPEEIEDIRNEKDVSKLPSAGDSRKPPLKEKDAPKLQPIDPTIISEAQHKLFFVKVKEFGLTNEVAKIVIENHGFKSSKDIKKDAFEKILQEMEFLGSEKAKTNGGAK